MLIDLPTALRIFEDRYFNLIRRGGDGSLVLSADRWRVADASNEMVRFQAEAPEAPELTLVMAEVERITWDRLPKQQARSQVRFYLRSGDLWTFSGFADEASMPSIWSPAS